MSHQAEKRADAKRRAELWRVILGRGRLRAVGRLPDGGLPPGHMLIDGVMYHSTDGGQMLRSDRSYRLGLDGRYVEVHG